MASNFKKTKHPNVIINIHSGTYYWREYIKGREFFISTREKQIGKALTKVKALRQEAGAGEVIVLQKSYLFDDLFDAVLEIQKSKSHKTYLSARTHIENYLRPWFLKNCPRIDFFMIDYEKYWAKYVKDSKNKNATRKLEHDRRHLVMAIHKAKNKGVIKRALSKKDLVLKESSRPIGQYIEDEDILKILKLSQEDEKFYLQVLMALMMGMRKSEILHLRKDEIDWQRNEINLDPSRLKTRLARKVAIPISDRVRPILKRYYEISNGSYVFPAIFRHVTGRPEDYNHPQTDITNLWHKIRRKLGVNYRFHDLRHTAITNMIGQGVPLTTVSKIVGASERTINRVYDHIRQDVKDQVASLFNDRFN